LGQGARSGQRKWQRHGRNKGNRLHLPLRRSFNGLSQLSARLPDQTLMRINPLSGLLIDAEAHLKSPTCQTTPHSRPSPRPRAWRLCTGGQGTEPYEQNTQQSPARGRINALQPLHS
jgi:hypothetical protein